MAHRRTYGAGRSHLISSRTGRCAMAAFNVGALVQKKTGGIQGVVDSQLEPEGDHPKAWVRWDDGNYSVHAENELRASSIDGPRMYKTLA
ncbi:TPA: hypothetical protein JG895_002578 [Enterobacter hormaechei subsp. steigerwaltii]|nr:hypothetical protein [Enterobacter hormaechei]EHF5008707.1 hypothetical protein [Enterobacter hormaechei]HAV1697939.1 hypothetical protein [Enterobacter hormaechei subsp. steigerwaltii]